MRNWTYWGLGLGVVIAGALFAGVGSQEAPSQTTNTVATLTSTGSVTEAKAPADQDTTMDELPEDSELADAAVTPISTEKPLPPNMRPTAPAAQVIKLAESGVEESVMMAFVTNSPSTFNLGAEDIIYLNDIGVPGSVLAAMMQRDKALKELSASALPAPAAPLPSVPTNQLVPGEPGLYAPQPVEGAVPAEMAPAPVPPEVADAGYGDFYDSLAPYGTWVNVAGWGAVLAADGGHRQSGLAPVLQWWSLDL